MSTYNIGCYEEISKIISYIIKFHQILIYSFDGVWLIQGEGSPKKTQKLTKEKGSSTKKPRTVNETPNKTDKDSSVKKVQLFCCRLRPNFMRFLFPLLRIQKEQNVICWRINEH